MLHYNVKRRRFIVPVAAKVIENIIPVSDFSRGKASQAFARAVSGSPVTVVRNNRPINVITSVEDYLYLSEVEENHFLLCEALERLERNGDEPTISLADVLVDHGITEENLASVADVEFE